MSNQPFEKLDVLVEQLMDYRKRNLLIMFYSDNYGIISDYDREVLYFEFKQRGVDHNRKIDLDIILHTTGGDPHTAYMLAKIVREFSKDVEILVPYYAYSAGTLFSFCANKILLGPYACLSPIDISYGKERQTELINIDYYMEFVKDCRSRLEETLKEIEKEHDRLSQTRVEDALLVELVRQIGALNIGKFYRERTLTGYYAKVLLENYLLSDHPSEDYISDLARHIISALLFQCPSHDFEIDYTIARELKLPVVKMNAEIFDLTKKIVDTLRELESMDIICRHIRENYKSPFIRLYMGKRG